VAVDPYIPVGKVPTDEHDVPLLVMAPLVGIAMVPVTPVVGAGLTPIDVSSVEPSGTPIGPIPSGEVAPSEGRAVSGSVSGSSTWANAGLAQSNGQAVAAIKKSLMKVSPIRAVTVELPISAAAQLLERAVAPDASQHGFARIRIRLNKDLWPNVF
jgi:hypothetical protein